MRARLLETRGKSREEGKSEDKGVEKRWMQPPSIDKTLSTKNIRLENETLIVNGSHVAKQTDGNIYSRRRIFCRRDKVCTCSLGNATLAAWKIGEPGRGEVRSRRML